MAFLDDIDGDAEQRVANAIVGVVSALVLAGVLVPARDWLGAPNVALVMVLPVLAAASGGGWIPGVVTAFVAALAFNVFHTQPYLSARVAAREDAVTIGLLLVVGVAAGVASARRARDRRSLLTQDEAGRLVAAWLSLLAARHSAAAVWDAVRVDLGRELAAACRLASTGQTAASGTVAVVDVPGGAGALVIERPEMPLTADEQRFAAQAAAVVGVALAGAPVASIAGRS